MALLAFVTFLPQRPQGLDTFRAFLPLDVVEFDVLCCDGVVAAAVVAVDAEGVAGPGCEWTSPERRS